MTNTATGQDEAFRLPDDAGIGRVRLRVADLKRSLRFYRDLIGLQVLQEEGSRLILSAAPGAAPARSRRAAWRRQARADPRPLSFRHGRP